MCPRHARVPRRTCSIRPPSGAVLGLRRAAGWSSSVARRAHNPEVAGSNPVPATRKRHQKARSEEILIGPSAFPPAMHAAAPGCEDGDMVASAPLVAVCQFAPTASRESNRARIAELVAESAARGARVVVLPEYSSYFTDPLDESLAVNAEMLDGDFVQTLRDLARAHGAAIVAGLVEQAD